MCGSIDWPCLLSACSLLALLVSHSFALFLRLLLPVSRLRLSSASSPVVLTALHSRLASLLPSRRQLQQAVRACIAALSLALTTAAATPQAPPKRSPTAGGSSGSGGLVDMSADAAYDLLFKFIIIGDSGTGKVRSHDAYSSDECLRVWERGGDEYGMLAGC